jgi:hypothetical protein
MIGGSFKEMDRNNNAGRQSWQEFKDGLESLSAARGGEDSGSAMPWHKGDEAVVQKLTQDWHLNGLLASVISASDGVVKVGRSKQSTSVFTDLLLGGCTIDVLTL